MVLGGALSIAVLAPNLAWLAFPSREPKRSASTKAEPRLVRALELVGRVGALAIPFFYDFPRMGALERVALVALLCVLAIYYACWVRDFVGGRHEASLYASLFGLPLPMAVAPVLFFCLGAVLLHSTPLAVAALALGASHVPLSKRRAKNF